MPVMVSFLMDAAIVLAAAAQVAAAPPSATGTSAAAAPTRNCDARKFESSAEATVNGEIRRARIQLCAEPGDSNEKWAATLEKAAAQIAASPQVTAQSKDKLRSEFASAIAAARSGKATSSSESALR